MGGGLMQLVAYGAQDIYLTGNPQITFFKVVYRRHTNFAVEAIEQTFNGAAAFGQKFSCTISRNGDLLSRVYLEVDATAPLVTDAQRDHAGFSEIDRYGFDIIDHVEVEVGGQCIDKHYGDWMNIWTDLTHGGDAESMLTDMVGAAELAAETGSPGGGQTTIELLGKLYIPLQFWFCRNPGLALPLIALQYHEVKVNVMFASAPTLNNAAGAAITVGTTTSTTANEVRGHSISSCCVFCDYIFLDTDERRRFAQVSHEYLIEQVQFSNALKIDTTGGQVELRFNHPVKEIFWHDNAKAANAQVMGDCLLQLNGHDRFRARDGSYFRNVQRYEHHTGAGSLANLNMYSFALKPEEHQPSGTCNFSRIDNAVLNIKQSGTTALSTTLKVYAMNYNVLRIMSGMGGLAYSN